MIKYLNHRYASLHSNIYFRTIFYISRLYYMETIYIEIFLHPEMISFYIQHYFERLHASTVRKLHYFQ